MKSLDLRRSANECSRAGTVRAEHTVEVLAEVAATKGRMRRADVVGCNTTMAADVVGDEARRYQLKGISLSCPSALLSNYWVLP
jgi:hypothetical protein